MSIELMSSEMCDVVRFSVLLYQSDSSSYTSPPLRVLNINKCQIGHLNLNLSSPLLSISL